MGSLNNLGPCRECAGSKPYESATEATEPREGKVIYNSWNLGYVDNSPTCSPFFTIDEPQMITYIDTYLTGTLAQAHPVE